MPNQLNQRASALLNEPRSNIAGFGVEVHSLSNGAAVFHFDANATTRFNASAGILLATICLADLGKVELLSSKDENPLALKEFPFTVTVETDQPLVACMASQYAGWPLSVGKYFAMASGPARSARGKEKVLQQYDLVAESDSVVVVLETSELPDESVAEAIARECNVAPDRVQICVARTACLSGTLQIVARSVETAMHKLHELGFNLTLIKKGIGSAPLPPLGQDDLQSLGWTNDSVLYGAKVVLTVDCEDSLIEEVGPKVPSSSSSDFGKPFLEIFEHFDRDFYKIDKMLFSPAKVAFENVRTGNRFEFGGPRFDILDDSWKVRGDG